MRQINADKLEREITLAYIETCRGLTLEQIDAVARFSAKVISIIGHTPTADTEAVVRCKDCKLRDVPEKCVAYEAFWDLGDDGFCNCGERKDEEDQG